MSGAFTITLIGIGTAFAVLVILSILTIILKDVATFLPGTPSSVVDIGSDPGNKDKAMAAAIAVSVALGRRSSKDVPSSTKTEAEMLGEDEPSDSSS